MDKSLICNTIEQLLEKKVKVVVGQEEVIKRRLFDREKGVILVLDFKREEEDGDAFHVVMTPPLNLKILLERLSQGIRSEYLKKLVLEKTRPLFGAGTGAHTYNLWGLIELLEENKKSEFGKTWKKTSEFILCLSKYTEIELPNYKNITENVDKILKKINDGINHNKIDKNEIRKELERLDRLLITLKKLLRG